MKINSKICQIKVQQFKLSKSSASDTIPCTKYLCEVAGGSLGAMDCERLVCEDSSVKSFVSLGECSGSLGRLSQLVTVTGDDRWLLCALGLSDSRS